MTKSILRSMEGLVEKVVPVVEVGVTVDAATLGVVATRELLMAATEARLRNVLRDDIN
jgi:hypothetical protein